jgi:hypothetical protein
MENIGYGLQNVTITVFFPEDNKKYSVHDHHLRYKWHEGNMRVKIWANGLKTDTGSRIHFCKVETRGIKF